MTPAAFVRDLTAFWVQIALVVIVVAGVLKVVSMPARARYVCLRLALLACLAAPWMLRSVVVITLEPRPERIAGAPVAVGPAEGLMAAVPQSATAAPAYVLPEIPWANVALVALFAGVAARGLWLAVGVLRLRRLRRRAMLVDSPDYAAAQQQVGTSAAIAQVEGLPQPVTFGFRRPIVLLPETLAAAPAALRRAVVTHELFHVRRGDWLSVLGEEVLRTLLWFHPAILWLMSHIQLAREEMVDELTVRATGDRRAYMQALLAFADTSGVHPAPAFAHRRQLFHRILSVSKEKAMSVPRVVASGVIVVTALAGASWYASTLFPIVKAAKADVQATAPPAADAQAFTQSGSRIVVDGNVKLRVGDMKVRASSAEVLFDQQTGQALAARPVTPENPIPRRARGVAPVTPSQYAGAQVVVSVRVTVDRNGAVTSVDPNSCSASGGRTDAAVCAAFHDATAAAIRQWRYDRPAQAPIQFYVRVTFRPGSEPAITQSGESWLSSVRETQDSLRVLAEASDDLLKARLAEMSAQFRELERAQRLVLERGPANPDLVKLQQELARMNDEMGRVEAQLRSVRGQPRAGDQERAEEQIRTSLRVLVEHQEKLQAAAEQLRQAQRQLEAAQRQPEQTTTAAVSPEPAPPVDGSRQLVSPSGRAPIRMNGPANPPGLEQPVPMKSVQATYPLDALQARLQGTVVVEVLVDERGRIADARVLRGDSLLQQAALDAARQWEFRPALLNGEPVPVLVMLEMHFKLK